MNRVSKIISLSLVAAIGATVVLAQATPEELSAVQAAREENMKGRGGALGVLGKMAQGEMAYDAAAASEAAATLVALTSMDESGWWLPGSEAGAIPESRALPAIWENAEDFAAKGAAMKAAAEAMQAAAGVDLASLQGAMAAVGGSCGGCHELYRAPE